MKLYKRQIRKRHQKMTKKGVKFFVSFQDWWPWLPATGVILLLTSCVSHNGESMEKEIEHTDEEFSIKTPAKNEIEHTHKEFSEKILAEKEIEYRGEVFSIKIPAGVEVEKRRPIDFFLYDFSIDGEHFLTAYVGNAPSYRSTHAQENTIETTGLINNVPFKRIECKSRSGQKHVEVLFQFQRNRCLMFMHFFYDDIPSNLESIAEKIINSLEDKVESH